MGSNTTGARKTPSFTIVVCSTSSIDTDLDPDFDYVYQFGGETIPFHEPSVNLWFNTKQSIALLGKGVEHHVQRWEVPWLLGYSLYAYWGRYADAGRAMTAAADLIDAVGQRAEARFAPPKYIRSLAVRLLAQGGDLETAIVATQLALAQSTDERARDELDQRLKSLVLQKDLDLLNRALEASTQSGQTIRNLGNLVRVGSLSSVPPDPFGGEFYIDAASKVRSTHESLLLKVYVHPGQQAIEPTAD